MDKEKFNILPYDFVKENQIIASQKTHGYEVVSPKKMTPTLYHELYKFLKKDSEKHFPSTGEASLSGVIIDCDVETGLAKNIKTFIHGGDLVNSH